MKVICRKATESDIEQIYALIAYYAEQGIMLPRSQEALRRQLEHFVVAETIEEAKDGTAVSSIVGCGSLFQLGSDLVEIRSLGILPQYKGQGIGKRIVDMLEKEARERSIPKLMALTYEVGFFEKNGFHVVPKEIFPEKVWTDCVHCKKQFCCDEIAVLKSLE